MDRQRRLVFAVHPLDPRAHAAQRVGHPIHGALRQPGAAGQRGRHPAAGQGAHQHAHRGAGIAAVQLRFGLPPGPGLDFEIARRRRAPADSQPV